ncbi:MAG TPA: hypothetical protein VGL40_15555 [Bacillota bacterium]
MSYGQFLDQRYRGRVKTTYIDVDDSAMDSHPKVMEMLHQRLASLPLLMVDGELLPDAAVTWRTISRLIELKGIKEAG